MNPNRKNLDNNLVDGKKFHALVYIYFVSNNFSEGNVDCAVETNTACNSHRVYFSGFL